VVALAGGVGGARFLRGLAAATDPGAILAVVNTADDFTHHGLRISPDIDTILYTFSGLVNEQMGWGVAGDTISCLEMLGRLGEPTWFRLGDRDLAMHLLRTRLLREGWTLSAVTDRIRRALGIPARVLPMTDDEVATEIETPEGLLPFQDYFVRRACGPAVRGVRFRGADHARPAPGVLTAIASARAIILCPSNPIVSIAPILAVPGIAEAIAASPARVAAVSPIVGGKALKGPADRMLRDLGHAATAAGVAKIHAGLADVFVLDRVDASLAKEVRALGLEPLVTDTIMAEPSRARALARAVLERLT
jgi:LPPG:FO 2-phospho-L-lactate transferase